MNLLDRLLKEPFAKFASKFMQYVCRFVIVFLFLCLLLSAMGRQSFTLHTGAQTYERAIYAEEDPATATRSFTVSMGDDVRVRANRDGRIDLSTHIGLTLMFAVQLVPLMFAYWFLSRVFANVREGRIFTVQNAAYLLYYGLLQFFTALLAPFFKLLLSFLFNCISESQISIATGQNMLNTLVPSIAFLVAAYIIRYGIYLQDEVDHTL